MSEQSVILDIVFDGIEKAEENAINFRKALFELKKEKSDLNKQLKSLDKTSEDYETQLHAITESLQEVETEIQKNNKGLRENQKSIDRATTAYEAQEGSLEQMRVQLAEAQKEYIKLSKTERENSETGKALKKTINELDSALKNKEESIGIHNRSVGDYGKAVKDLTPMMGDFGGQINTILGGLDKLKDVFTNLTQSSGNTTRSVVRGFGAVSSSSEDASNTVTNSMGKATGATMEYQTAQQISNSTTNEGRNVIKGFAQTQQTATQATQAQAKATNSQTVATASMTTATGGANTALKLFRIALISTGIGAIVVLLGSLIAAVASTQQGMDKLNRILIPIKEVFAELFGVIQNVGLKALDTFIAGFKTFSNVLNLRRLQIVKGITSMRIAWNEFTGDSEKAEELREELKKTQEEILETQEAIKQGAEDVINGFKGMADEAMKTGDRLNKAFGRGGRLAILKEEIETLESTQKLREANLQLEIETARRLRKDKSLSDAEREKAMNRERQATKELRAIEIDLINKKREKLELEAEANDTSKKDLKEINDLQAQAVMREAELQKDLVRIEKEHNARVKKDREDALKAIEDQRKAQEEAEKARIEALKKEEAERLKANINAKKEALKVFDLENQLRIKQTAENAEERLKMEIEYVKLRYEQEKEIAELEGANLEAIKLQQEITLLDKKKELDEIAKQEELEREKEQADKVKLIRQSALEAVAGVQQIMLDNQTRKVQVAEQRQLDALQGRLNSGLISEEEFNEERQKIEKEAFDERQKIAVRSAVSQGALAVIRAFADTPFPTSLLTSALVAGKTATEVATIRSQSFARGGFTGVSNLQRDHTGERPVGIVHEKEFVANRQALGTPRGMDLAQQLNAINQNPSLGYFANGGFTSAIGNNVDLNQLSDRISGSLQTLQVVNVASDTQAKATRVKNIQNRGRI